jgi:hypothetical protein
VSYPEKVECRGCYRQVRVLKSGAFATHSYQRNGVKHACERSGQKAPLHGGTFRIVSRDPNVWLCECDCSLTWLGPEHDDVEKPWSAHCKEAGAS